MRTDDWLIAFDPMDRYEFTAATAALPGANAGFPDIYWFRCEGHNNVWEDCLTWISLSDMGATDNITASSYFDEHHVVYCENCAISKAERAYEDFLYRYG